MPELILTPSTIKAASAFVRAHHRHHIPPPGGLWAVAIEQAGAVVGVAIVGRPGSRHLQDGYTAEVTRVGTDGARNGCSMLYGACRRAAKALGYRRLITYTLIEEPGTSLRAAGWRRTAETRGEKV